MSKHASICDSDGCRIGEMICETCHKPITGGLFLNIDYHVSKRGNEDDYTRQWHQECSKNHPEWAKYESEIKLSKERQELKLKNAKKRAIELIKKAHDVDIDENGSCIFNITCTVVQE
jgi:hypothetical protein